jgi:putative heme-binding domain-containing protein
MTSAGSKSDVWFTATLTLVVVALGVVVESAATDDKSAPLLETKPLIVCAVPASMPRMDKAPDGTPRGIDVELIQAVGRVLERKIEFHWCASADCGWHCLPEKRCDVVIGQPHGSAPKGLVAWSVPYAGARFGLAARAAERDARSLADFRGKRVGIVAGTVALSERDHVVHRSRSREALLDELEAGHVDAAFVDADFAAWSLHERPRAAVKLISQYIPRERWNMAMAVRAGDSQLLLDLNRALAQLTGSGVVRKIYARHGVPFEAPFDASDRAEVAPETWRRIEERAELVVGFDPANLPYSSARAERPGFDVELAQALARELGVKLKIEWVDIQHATAIGQLLERKCDLVFGEAVAANAMDDDDELAKKVVYSRPYYGAGYVLVRRKDGPAIRSLSEIQGPRSERLGTEAGSIADYSLRRRGYLRRLFRNQLATLYALNTAVIDYAYLWANVGWTLHSSPDLGLEIVANGAPEDRWNIAIAVRKEDVALRERVDVALGRLITDGTVARALARYHMPSYPLVPGSTSDPRASAEHPIQHAVANRGLEPRMQTVQKSKEGYSGLARVRSAGELVVGLDQNNMPFSAAHPAPMGLDYDLACELARQMGVRLRVFWALAAHDSYPSKLTTKALCDVILGVMPDDRFEQRVLYSRPYYHAAYRWAVRGGAAPPTLGSPVAVEQGVAVRGLAGYSPRTYPDTDAILEAVALGRIEAGYVISTRSLWLAHERFAGKLAFLPVSQSVDCFPICAVVRKRDHDLKEAIDHAWDDLDRSGRMAEVFARWHIPRERVEATGGTKDSAPWKVPIATQRETGSGGNSAGAVPPPDNAALMEGQALFRGLCTGCHGGTGRGGKGPDLTDNRWIHGGTDQDIARVIQNGVPRTTMKKLGDALKDEQIRKLIGYIRSLARSAGETTWKPYFVGDAAAGRRSFLDLHGKAHCVQCHSVAGEGGRIGPALDRIASRRSPEFVMESILEPAKEIAPEYEAVIVATNDGRVITGLRVNETNFSIQLTGEDGRFYSFLKRDLEQVKVLTKSLMPENFSELLTVRELHDLFTYLMTLE